MNPAERLLLVFDEMLKQPQTGSISHMWAGVFGIPADPGNHQHDDEVVACTQALRAELAATKALLLAKSVKSSMLEPCFSRMALAATAGGLHKEWPGYRGNLIGPEIRLALEWAAWALSSDEDDLSAEAISALVAELDELEAAARADGVSPYVRELCLRCASQIRSALRVYRVRGLAALADALQTTAGAMVSSKSIVATEVASGTPETRSVVSKLKGVFDGLVKTAEGLDRINKGIEAAKNVYKSLSEVWSSFPSLPPPQ